MFLTFIIHISVNTMLYFVKCQLQDKLLVLFFGWAVCPTLPYIYMKYEHMMIVSGLNETCHK